MFDRFTENWFLYVKDFIICWNSNVASIYNTYNVATCNQIASENRIISYSTSSEMLTIKYQ